MRATIVRCTPPGRYVLDVPLIWLPVSLHTSSLDSTLRMSSTSPPPWLRASDSVALPTSNSSSEASGVTMNSPVSLLELLKLVYTSVSG